MTSDNRARTTWPLLALVFVACFASISAYAHPMGNLSVNHYTQITIRDGHIEILFIIDMAEIPTFQEMQEAGIFPKVGDQSLAAYLPAKATSLKDNLALEVEGNRLPLKVISQQIIFPPGAGNLPTIKMAFVYRAELPASSIGSAGHLRFADRTFPGHAGWKEIIVDAPAGALISSTAPEKDRSNHLTNYPTDLLNSPPQDLEASIAFDPSVLAALSSEKTHPQLRNSQKRADSRATTSANLDRQKTPTADGVPAQTQRETVTPNQPIQPIQLQANQQGTPRNLFTELISKKNLGFWFLLGAAAIAGALHALEPGHGKTIVAAYLVGSRGTAWNALLLGVVVTVSHTAAVYLLGAVILFGQKYILPEQTFPFLGVLSGILIAGMGCYLLLQRYLGPEFAHRHDRYVSVEGDKPGAQKQKAFTSQLLLLGISGGILPCPTALVVLLSAAAHHRTALGLFLIVAFSIGLAAVLIAMGLVALYARRLLSGPVLERPLFQRWLPMASATFIMILGFVITGRALIAAGIIHFRLWA